MILTFETEINLQSCNECVQEDSLDPLRETLHLLWELQVLQWEVPNNAVEILQQYFRVLHSKVAFVKRSWVNLCTVSFWEKKNEFLNQVVSKNTGKKMELFVSELGLFVNNCNIFRILLYLRIKHFTNIHFYVSQIEGKRVNKATRGRKFFKEAHQKSQRESSFTFLFTQPHHSQRILFHCFKWALIYWFTTSTLTTPLGTRKLSSWIHLLQKRTVLVVIHQMKTKDQPTDSRGTSTILKIQILYKT